VKLKEAKAALVKRGPALRNKVGSEPSLSAPKAKRAEPAAEQEILVLDWYHIFCVGHIVNQTSTDSIPTPEPLIAPIPKVAVTTSAKGKKAKSMPKVTVDLNGPQ
jgi:hypothetical protein